MKNSIFTLLLGAAAFFVSGCSKNTPQETEGPSTGSSVHTLNVSASTDAITRSGMNPAKDAVIWLTGDKIGLFAADNSNTVLSEAGITGAGRSALFSGAINGAIEDNTTYYMYFPYTSGATLTANKLTFPFPGTINYGESGVRDIPMVAKFTGKESEVNATFKQLFAIMQVSLLKNNTSKMINVQRITFEGKNGENIAGNVSVDMSAASFSADLSAATGKTITLNCANSGGVQLDKTTPVQFFIAVPAMTYSNGYKLSIETDDETFVYNSGSGAVALSKGEVFESPEYVVQGEITVAPTELFLHGTGIRGDAEGRRFRIDENGEFVIFARLQAGTLYLKSETGDRIYYNGTKFVYGDGTFVIEGNVGAGYHEGYCYRITINYTANKLDVVQFFNDWSFFIWAGDNSNMGNIVYRGAGIFSCGTVGSEVSFTPPSIDYGGGDVRPDYRYCIYFPVNYPVDNTRMYWGAASVSQPDANTPQLYYNVAYNMVAPGTDAFDWNHQWMMRADYVDKKGVITIDSNIDGPMTLVFSDVVAK
ncbi:hypothetical protein FACS1894159_07900 [Bacteroidia bacterium]|nr:hypothetical protein FACS1894159_07900 [Bacteroidia bacterium]